MTPDGYLIELGGCFSFRPPPQAWLRKHAIVSEAIANAIEMTRPGLVADDIVSVIRRTYEKAGMEIVGRRLWDFHGQGMHSILKPFGLRARKTNTRQHDDQHPPRNPDGRWSRDLCHEQLSRDAGRWSCSRRFPPSMAPGWLGLENADFVIRVQERNARLALL